MHSAACQFYQDLYSLTPVDPDAITDLLSHLPAVCGLSPSVRDDLLRPFTVADLLDSVNRSPVQSSPGLDSLPYSVLVLLFGHPALSDLICQVYNDALLRATFPAAWMSTCICLLPKKGDLTTLSNWRPIALINTDAKIFTRLLNSRMILVCSDIVDPYQTGFPHGRYIADNTMLVRLVMDQHSVPIARRLASSWIKRRRMTEFTLNTWSAYWSTYWSTGASRNRLLHASTGCSLIYRFVSMLTVFYHQQCRRVAVSAKVILFPPFCSI